MNVGLLYIDNKKYSANLLDFISETRKNKIERYNNDFDKKISLFSELLLRIMLKDFGEKTWKSICITEKSNGRPILSNNPKYSFSISHSEGMIICAVDQYNKLGLDTEKDSSCPIEISNFVFHKNECIRDINRDIFYNIWTAKEAYSKYTENGLSMDFTKIDTTSSIFKEHLVQWKENDFYCCIYADNVKDIKIKRYTEKEILKDYD